MAAPPPLPGRFPCWCRAVYSWGGEGKRDLGFIEGDLIECLNAGDGSWWTGRLYRDRRTVGSFPSNFVEVLPESFRPSAPQTTSTMPANNAPPPGAVGAAKSKSFRKPFEAYSKAPHYTTAKQPVTYIGGGQSPPKNDPPKVAVARRSVIDHGPYPPFPNVGRPNIHYGSQVSRSPGPQQMYASRSVSPAPAPQQHYGQRAVSPAPLQGYPPVTASPGPVSHRYGARSVSPAPPHGYISREASPAVQGYHSRNQSQYNVSRSTSPAPQQHMQRSVSPAPPPQHRQSYLPRAVSPAPHLPSQELVNYSYRRAASPAPLQHNSYMPRSHSPAPYSQYDNQMQRSASPAPPQGHHYSNSMQMQRSASPVPPAQHHYSSSMQMQRSASPASFRDDYTMQRDTSPAPPQHYRQDSRAYSPGPNNYQSYSRAASPAPLATYGSQQDQYRRANSPAPLRQAPLRQNSYDQRSVSPAPYQRQQYGQRSVSPAPPPPDHHSSYNGRSPSPAPSRPYQTEDRFCPYSPAPPVSSQQLMQFQPATDNGVSGAPPPAPPPHRQMTRQGSATSYMGDQNLSRQVSNNSYTGSHDLSRQSSQVSYDRHPSNQLSRNDSQVSYMDQQQQPPPISSTPAPPLANSRFRAYSVATPSQLATATLPPQNRFQPQTPRATSPLPPPNMTPSPLREAMDGVMEQLETLRMSRVMNGDEVAPAWGPDSFDMVSRQARKESNARPQTAMGLSAQDSGYETWSGESSQSHSQTQSQAAQNQQEDQPVEKSPLPELSSYVERMEKSLEQMHEQVPVPLTNTSPVDEVVPTPKAQPFERPKSSTSLAREDDNTSNASSFKKVRARKSAYDVLNRTSTTKTTSTNASSGNQSTITQNSDRSLMSGVSAGGISATSAGSFERRRGRAQSALGVRGEADIERPDSPFTGVSYHSSHASNTPLSPMKDQSSLAWQDEAPGLGGLVQPKTPKRNIFKKLLDSAKTGVASSRNSIAFNSDKNSPNRSPIRSSPTRNLHTSAGGSSINLPGTAALAFGHRSSPFSRSAGRDAGLASQNKAVDWVQVRRDVNRSNSLSRIERNERLDRARMLDYPAIDAVEELYTTYHGDEAADGSPVETPIDIVNLNLNLVDKNSRFLANIPPTTTAGQLATGYVCRPYRSEVQKLRAIFTWVSEKVCWEEDFEGQIDTTRTINTKRGSAEEYAVLVAEMCEAVGIICEVVRGYLKPPGEGPEGGHLPRSNHWWNAVIVENEWRMIDACLASPSNPMRAKYSSVGSSSADHFWFLTLPSEICWTHMPEHHGHQHFCQPVAHEVLLNLPGVCPPFFRDRIELHDYNSAVGRIQGLEMVQLKVNVPGDIELAAEVEVRGYSKDSDGDCLDNGEMVTKRALAQAEWYGGIKRYTIKALLPGDEGLGTLKVYAGKRGLMHSIKDIPHPLAFAIPIVHSGENPPYDFVTRHPTPHAQRHDIYVVQPQCQRLALNNTFVFAVRQHPSASYASGAQSALTPASNPGDPSTPASPYHRPGSAMSISAASSNPSNSSGTVGGKKPAKLAIQTPGGKILRLMRKEDRKGISSAGLRLADGDASDGGTWETIIKCSETGTWRGLVLADRTARWCVFAEWTCM